MIQRTSGTLPVDIDSDGKLKTRNYIWNTSSLAWEAATGSLTGGGNVTVNNFPAGMSTEATLAKMVGLAIPIHDYISLTYTGSNLTGVVFKTGGSVGSTVATLTLAYTGAILTSVTKT